MHLQFLLIGLVQSTIVVTTLSDADPVVGRRFLRALIMKRTINLGNRMCNYDARFNVGKKFIAGTNGLMWGNPDTSYRRRRGNLQLYSPRSNQQEQELDDIKPLALWMNPYTMYN